MGRVGRAVGRVVGAVATVAKTISKSGLFGQIGKIASSILSMVPGGGNLAGVAGKALEKLGGDVGKTKQWMAEGLAAFGPLQQARRLGEQVVSLPSSPFQPLGNLGGAPGGGALGKQLHALMGEIQSHADSLKAGLGQLQAASGQPGLLLPASGGTVAEVQQQLLDATRMLQELLQQVEPPRAGMGQVVIR